MQWTRQPQEQEGTYMFSGQFYVTHAVLDILSHDDITFIYLDLKHFVKENNGADYLQIYDNGAGERLYLIDQINREIIESGNYKPDDNHCTSLFSWEY